MKDFTTTKMVKKYHLDPLILMNFHLFRVLIRIFELSCFHRVQNLIVLFLYLLFPPATKVGMLHSQDLIKNYDKVSQKFSPESRKSAPLNDDTPEIKKFNSPRKKGLLIRPDDPDDSKRWAIVIGVNDYNDVAIQDLKKARNDAKIIGQILKEQGEFEKVFIMTDDVDPKDPLYPTRINIEEKIDTIMSYANPYDTVIFYFSGHGVSDDKGNGFILPVDTVMDKVNYSSIKIDLIIKKLNERRITKSLIFLDACRDIISTTRSATREGLQADKYQNAEVGATFFSTKAGYYSFEDPSSDFGIFTKYIAYGMEGNADLNGDGIVSFSELEDYVQREVNNWSLSNNKKQKPFVRYFKEKYGDIPITIKAKREKSLVDKNNYNQDGREYLWKSALIPGWGQWEKNEPTKAGIYLGGTLIGLGLIGMKYNDYNEKIQDYNQTSSNFQLVTPFLLPLSEDALGDPINLYSYITINTITSQREFIKDTAIQMNYGLGILFIFYLTNTVDAYLPRQNISNKSKGFNFDFKESGTLSFDLRPDINNMSYNFSTLLKPQYLVEYTWRF